ncbi:MAG: type II 3-dehydroquinate dehydratase [Clostridiales bacterium]|nr:type II 3-dehydroquinate dehydratase [Clostridiales bacterium]
MNFLIINGVNLNLTGKREKDVYGGASLEEINEKIAAFAAKNGNKVDFYQSNIEGELVDKLHEAYLKGGYDGILLNAGAYSHYSYALRDAIAAIDVPVVEVHMSNVHARESFRHTSVLSEVCKGVVCGFGAGSYIAALVGLQDALNDL